MNIHRIIKLAALPLLLFFYFSNCMSGPNLKDYEPLKSPRITAKQAQKVLTIEITGDPDKTAGIAFGRLFKTKYKLKNDSLKESWPKARWPKSFETPRNEYLGIFAVPVSNEVNSLPEGMNNPDPKVTLTTWEYGEVAEILHIGSYDEENPTINKLKKFIETSGYEISGMHEEEYLKGPGMLFEGDEDDYQTIIRYPVKKKGGKK